MRTRYWLVIAFITALALSTRAWAIVTCDACVVAAIQEHKIEMIAQFSLLKQHLTAEFDALKDHISAEVKTLRQSVAQVEKDAWRAQSDINAILPTRGCESATAADSAGPARDRVEAYNRAFNHIRTEHIDGTQAAVVMYDNHIKDYCTPEDIGTRGCEEIGDRPNAHFLLETLLSGSGVGEETDNASPNSFMPEMLSFDADRVVDAQRFIENAIDAFPIGDMEKDLQETPQGISYWIRKKTYEAKLSFSRNSMNYALAMRLPSAALRAWLDQVWQETKAGEHADQLLAELPDEISYLELLKAEVDRRYAAPSWYAGIAGSPATSLLREQTYMQAQQLNLAYQQLRQGERIEMLLARLVADSAEGQDRDAVKSELAAAAELTTPDDPEEGTGPITITDQPTDQPPLTVPLSAPLPEAQP